MRVPDRPRTRRVWVDAAVVLGVVALYTWSARGVGASVWEILRGLPAMVDFVSRTVPPDMTILPRLDKAIIETVQLAVVGTTVGVFVALPLSVLGARNFIGATPVYYATRALFNALRGISEFVYALLFVAMVGLGPFPGALALAVHTTGALGKYFSEAIENMDWQPMEAIAATGASRTQLVFHGVLPQLTPQFLAYGFYYFEHNIRASTVLGLVGAGGLGIELMTSLKLFKYREVAAVVIVMLVLITAADQLSAWARRRAFAGSVART